MRWVAISAFLVALMISSVECRAQGGSAKPQTRKFKHNSKVETIYDQVKNQTTTYLRPMTVSASRGTLEAQIISEGKRTETIPEEVLLMTAYFISPGKSQTKPEFITIGFRSWTMDKTKYDNDRTLVIDFDGSSNDLGAMDLLERRIDPNMELKDHRYFLESLEKALPYEMFLRFSNASSAKVTVARRQYQLQNEHLEALRDLLSRIH